MRRRPGGFILVLAILIAAALMFSALMYVRHYRAELDLAGGGERKLVAREAALAGIAAAAFELKKDRNWTAGLPNVALQASGASYHVTFTAGPTPYSTNNSQGTVPVTGWDGRTVPAGTIHLVSVGTSGAIKQTEQALVSPPFTPYTLALMGSNQGVLGTNTLIDAFDSTLGPYSVSRDPVGNADIGTNTTATGKIVLGKGSAVNGKVRVGPGGTSSVVKNQGGAYQGIFVPTAIWPESPLSPPRKSGSTKVAVNGTVTLAPGVYGDVRGSGTLVLSAGVYIVRSLDLLDNASIVVTSGPVEFWFANRARFGRNNRINVAGTSKALKFYGAGTSGNDFDIGANSVGAFTMYAPAADMVIGDGTELFGSFLGKTFNTGTGVKLHLDRALKEVSTAFGFLTQW